MQNIHRIELNSTHGKVNVYLLLGEEITLVDAGENSKSCYDQLVKALKSFHIEIGDIQKLILTHMHKDHVGLTYSILQQSNASLYVNAKARYSFIENTEEPPDEYNREKDYITKCYEKWDTDKPNKIWGRLYSLPVPKDRIFYLNEGDFVFAGDSYYNIIETPGHSQLDICLYNENEKRLFCGDLMLPNISPVTYIEAPFPNEAERPSPLIQYMSSLAKIPPDQDLIIYPGHGDEFRGSQEWIEKRLNKIESKCERIMEVIEGRKDATVHTLCQQLYEGPYKRIPYTILSDIVSHLELMSSRGNIKFLEKKGVYQFEIC